jgi:hypothetical protein
VCSGSSIEIVHVRGTAPAVGGLIHDAPQQFDGVGDGVGEGVLDGDGRRFAVPRLRKIGYEKAVDDSRLKVGVVGLGTAVSPFSVVQDALGNQQALLLEGNGGHHIVPHAGGPARGRTPATGWITGGATTDAGHDPHRCRHYHIGDSSGERQRRKTERPRNLDILHGMCILLPGGETLVVMPFA